MTQSKIEEVKNIQIIFVFISLLSILITGSLYLWYSNTDKRLKQVEDILQVQNSMGYYSNISDTTGIYRKLLLERDSLIKILEIKGIKESYYLTQLDLQSNWFILFVSGIFVVFGLASYAVFRYEINTITIKQHNQNKQYESHFKKFEDKYNNLDSDIRKVVANFYAIASDLHMKADSYLFAMQFKVLAIENILVASKNVDTPYDDISGFVKQNIKKSIECLIDIEREVKQIKVDYTLPSLGTVRNIVKTLNAIITNDYFTDSDSRYQCIEILSRLNKAFKLTEPLTNLPKNL